MSAFSLSLTDPVDDEAMIEVLTRALQACGLTSSSVIGLYVGERFIPMWRRCFVSDTVAHVESVDNFLLPSLYGDATVYDCVSTYLYERLKHNFATPEMYGEWIKSTTFMVKTGVRPQLVDILTNIKHYMTSDEVMRQLALAFDFHTLMRYDYTNPTIPMYAQESVRCDEAESEVYVTMLGKVFKAFIGTLCEITRTLDPRAGSCGWELSYTLIKQTLDTVFPDESSIRLEKNSVSRLKLLYSENPYGKVHHTSYQDFLQQKKAELERYLRDYYGQRISAINTEFRHVSRYYAEIRLVLHENRKEAETTKAPVTTPFRHIHYSVYFSEDPSKVVVIGEYPSLDDFRASECAGANTKSSKLKAANRAVTHFDK